ncbi:MAG TPA: OmpA family protein [Gemmatimonadales bacterium]|nr:OmpA family protein [Gemmatimonadales bacterium]
MRVRALTTALLLAAAPGVAAQSPGTFELGGFGVARYFSDTTQVDDHLGGGGWIGFYPLRNLAIHTEASYADTRLIGLGTKVSNIPVRARLTYTVPLGDYASGIQIGAGYVRNLYRNNVHIDEDGVTALVGLRLGLSPNVQLRVAGVADWIPSPTQNTSNHYMNFGIQTGIGLMLGNSYDNDRDGVKNNADRCPNTPRGETVDADGCSASQRDTDNDGVKDNADKCPNTPTGERVDADGCSPSQLDADGDGVTDTADKCANTPKGEAVDANGCSDSQKDDDKDGVTNTADKCPNTPAGEQVDANGCSATQLDSDGDGVANAADACADTPKGAPVDARGCPRDTDADGVPDHADKCPNTPNGQAVDEGGCPILFKRGERRVVLQGVNFATGKAELTDSSKLVLEDVAQQLKANPEVRVEVQGHTDNVGSKALNQRLSEARAKTVEQFLEANGVSPSQVTSKGYGMSKPVASNKTAEGRAKNRRVELNRIN